MLTGQTAPRQTAGWSWLREITYYQLTISIPALRFSTFIDVLFWVGTLLSIWTSRIRLPAC
jgi:hypothetical protein